MKPNNNKVTQMNPEDESENEAAPPDAGKKMSKNERRFHDTSRRNQAFVATVIMEVIKSCPALGCSLDEKLLPQMQSLADQVIAGLPLDFEPKVSTVQLTEAVHAEMRSKFGQYMNIEEDVKDPLKEAAMAECIQSQILFFTKKRTTSGFTMFSLGVAAGVLVAAAATFKLGWLKL